MDGTYDSFCRPGFVNSIKKLRSDLMGGSKVLQGTDRLVLLGVEVAWIDILPSQQRSVWSSVADLCLTFKSSPSITTRKVRVKTS